ncbi:MAG: hypothetical protein JO166_17065, partial [Deltaproteobacteria bacterium]|nr:hypothetical protein [Deltaproteobacteria bacterium]
SVIVALANIFFHGLAFLVIRHYRIGLLFFGTEILSIFAFSFSPLVGNVLFWINWLVSQLLATRLAILDERRKLDRSLAPRRAASALKRWGVGTPLVTVLLLFDLIPFLVLHGLAHLLAGRRHRAVKLFGLELLGAGCLWIAWFYFSGMYAPITAFPTGVSDVLLWLYGGIGSLLFVGTFLWDLIPVLSGFIQHERHQYGWTRRAPLYAALASNPWAAQYILEQATVPRGDARWARRLVCRTAELMPSDQLIESLKNNSRRPGYLLRTLKRIKNRSIILALGHEWSSATPRVRRWIVDVLAGRPNEASLEQLTSARCSLDRYGWLRYALATFHFRLRLWPATALLVFGLLAPLSVLALYEVDAMTKNPARPVLRSVQDRPLREKMPDDRLLETLQYLAKVDQVDEAKKLEQLFDDTTNEDHQLWKSGLERVSIAACSLPSDPADPAQAEKLDRLRQNLVSVLAEGVKSKQTGATQALQLIEYRPNSCNLTQPSRRQLVAAGAALQKSLQNSTSTPQDWALAIAALGASGDPGAIEPLKTIAWQLAQRPDAGNLEWKDLPRNALAALNLNPSPEAATALRELATAPKISPELTKQAKQFADRRSQDRYKILFADANRHFDAADYQGAYAAASQLLGFSGEQQDRSEIMDLLGNAAYQLAVDATAGSREWATRAIDYLEQEKDAQHWGRDKSRKLSNAYAVRAGYLIRENNFDAAFADASRAITEDPSSYLGYAERAWAFQENSQPQKSLEDALTAISKNPESQWGYGLVRDAYLLQATGNPRQRRKLVYQAIDQFQTLRKQYPTVVWPNSELAVLYHDSASEFDPQAFQRAYELGKQLNEQFVPQLPVDQKFTEEANFMEA